MQLQAFKGKLENGDSFIKIDTRQLAAESATLLLFGESVSIHKDAATPFARITEWYLNGTKKVTVSYSNR